MIHLGEIGVGIALVDDVVEMLQHLPHRHRLAIQRQVLRLLADDEVERLILMVLAIELLDVAGRFFRVVAERGGGFPDAHVCLLVPQG